MKPGIRHKKYTKWFKTCFASLYGKRWNKKILPYLEEDEDITVLPTIVREDQARNFLVVVANTSLTTVNRKSGTKLGTVSILKLTTRVRHEGMPVEVNVDIVELDCPHQYRERLTKLFRNNKQVLANSDKELGKTHTVNMSIDMGDCYVLTFWPGQKCQSRWCTGRKWHILMAVMRGNRVGGNWLMKWDELKNSHGALQSDAPEESDLWTAWQLFPLDDDFKDRVGVERLYNSVEFDEPVELSSGSSWVRRPGSRIGVASRVPGQLEWRCGRESHTRPRGPSGTPMEFGDLRSCW